MNERLGYDDIHSTLAVRGNEWKCAASGDQRGRAIVLKVPDTWEVKNLQNSMGVILAKIPPKWREGTYRVPLLKDRTSNEG